MTVFGKEIGTSQLADDTTLFLKNNQQIMQAINLTLFFSRASGLHLNMKTCELMAIHDCFPNSLYNILIQNIVKNLGVAVGRDGYHNELNFGSVPGYDETFLYLRECC